MAICTTGACGSASSSACAANAASRASASSSIRSAGTSPTHAASWLPAPKPADDPDRAARYTVGRNETIMSPSDTPLHGAITALVTPLRSGEVDLAALGRLVDDQIAAGIHG